MIQPAWKEIKSKFLKSITSRKIQGVVLHCTAGNGRQSAPGQPSGDTKYLAQPGDGRRVSVDFTIERDGTIFRHVPMSASASKDLLKTYGLHAGRATAFKGLKNGQVTRGTVGIELCQNVGLKLTPIWPEAQVKACAELCAWLTDKYKLVTSDITTHRAIITDGSRSDPRQFPFDGPKGFWQFYWEAKGKGDSFRSSQVIQKVPDDDKFYTVVAGDGWFPIVKKLKAKGIDVDALTLAQWNNRRSIQEPPLIGEVLRVTVPRFDE